MWNMNTCGLKVSWGLDGKMLGARFWMSTYHGNLKLSDWDSVSFVVCLPCSPVGFSLPPLCSQSHWKHLALSCSPTHLHTHLQSGQNKHVHPESVPRDNHTFRQWVTQWVNTRAGCHLCVQNSRISNLGVSFGLLQEKYSQHFQLYCLVSPRKD